MSSINYDLAKIKAVVFDVDGVLSPSVIPMGADGVPQRMANIKDGYAMQFAVKCGLKLAIITGADSEAVRVRYNALGIRDVYIGAGKKAPLLVQWMEQNNLAPEEVAYAGDDVPDYESMMLAGLRVAPADAAADIKRIANYISSAAGGYGVARDILEQTLRAHGKWMMDEKAFGW